MLCEIFSFFSSFFDFESFFFFLFSTIVGPDQKATLLSGWWETSESRIRESFASKKVIVLGDFLVCIFPHSDRIRTRKTPNTETFYAVIVAQFKPARVSIIGTHQSRVGGGWLFLYKTQYLFYRSESSLGHNVI